MEIYMNCKNYDLCKGEALCNGLCMNCGSWFKVGGFGWDELNFFSCNEECIICSEVCSKKMMFPTNCGHSFCISCSKGILFFDESRYWLSPVKYGCLPCPKGCINPEKGKQCDCIEYDDVIERWSIQNTRQYERWNKEQEKSIQIGNPNSVNGRAQCPLCRRKYIRNGN